MPRIVLFSVAIVLAAFSVGVWLALLRPVEARLAAGIIISKTHKPAGEYAQYPSGLNRESFYGPNRIPVAECYILIMHVDELAADVGYAANVLEAETYKVGQRVSLRYQVRGIPGIWRRVFVIGVSH